MFKIMRFKITVEFKEITWKDEKLSVYTLIHWVSLRWQLSHQMLFFSRLCNSGIKLHKGLLQKDNALYLAHQPSDTKPASKSWNKAHSKDKKFLFWSSRIGVSCVGSKIKMRLFCVNMMYNTVFTFLMVICVITYKSCSFKTEGKACKQKHLLSQAGCQPSEAWS